MQFILHPSVSILCSWDCGLGLLGRNHVSMFWILHIVFSISVNYIYCTAACILREKDQSGRIPVHALYMCVKFYGSRKNYTLRTRARADIHPSATTLPRKTNKYSLLRKKVFKLPYVSRLLPLYQWIKSCCFLSTDEEAAASKRMEVLILFRAIMNIY